MEPAVTGEENVTRYKALSILEFIEQIAKDNEAGIKTDGPVFRAFPARPVYVVGETLA